MPTTEIPQQSNPIWDDLCRQKGELVTQMEIAQQKLQLVNNQIGQILAQQQAQPPK